MSPMPVSTIEFDDIQGLVRFGYKHLTQACFLLLRVRRRGAARNWLAQAPVTSALGVQPPPRVALQVALSCAGLRALGVADDIVDAFSPEFVAGMGSDPSRARRLGDVGASDPARWQWGAGDMQPHAVLLLYAVPGELAGWRQHVSAQCQAGFDVQACLATNDLSPTEPFGFVDGLAQPRLDWERRRAVQDRDLLAYTNTACLGEFLLGYPNEYAGYTERPLLDPARDAQSALLPRAEDAPDQADLGRNGSYLVVRQLQQDVRGFWRFLDRQAGGDPTRRKQLAEAMVGRTMEGEPLVGRTHARIDGVPDGINAFTYRSDPQGLRCPLGAHIRRSNPRNADLPPGAVGLLSRAIRMLGFNAAAREQDLVASTRFHRLLRRGRDYGTRLSLDQALAEAPEAQAGGDQVGLHFICLNASIARQFEFVQGAWLAGNTKFNALPGESDPLLGQREPGLDDNPIDVFSMPRAAGPDARIEDLPPFVTVRGGAYFFLPGLRALRYLATA